jgi:hypothetical protein
MALALIKFGSGSPIPFRRAGGLAPITFEPSSTMTGARDANGALPRTAIATGLGRLTQLKPDELPELINGYVEK